jgi:CxxC motif-containing protein
MEHKKMICISCPIGCIIEVKNLDGEININGNRCKSGEEYAINEINNPKRIVTSTLKVNCGNKPLVSVKTDKEVPKNMIFDVMKFINTVQIDAPVKVGDVLIGNILNTGVNIIATSNNDISSLV